MTGSETRDLEIVQKPSSCSLHPRGGTSLWRRVPVTNSFSKIRLRGFTSSFRFQQFPLECFFASESSSLKTTERRRERERKASFSSVTREKGDRKERKKERKRTSHESGGCFAFSRVSFPTEGLLKSPQSYQR